MFQYDLQRTTSPYYASLHLHNTLRTMMKPIHTNH